MKNLLARIRTVVNLSMVFGVLLFGTWAIIVIFVSMIKSIEAVLTCIYNMPHWVWYCGLIFLLLIIMCIALELIFIKKDSKAKASI